MARGTALKLTEVPIQAITTVTEEFVQTNQVETN